MDNRSSIVCIGGGTGLATVLRGLKAYSCTLSAIVTVADDGGSSGRLRKGMGILPPGDIRNCLVALAEAEPDMTALFNHRFKKGELRGHNFGNLFLAAMTEMTGDFQVAVKAMSSILAVKGKVLPATLCDVTLAAEMLDGTIVKGEVNIPLSRKGIKRLYLEPGSPLALDEAIDEIQQAGCIIIGPGSLYTSVIPNLLVPGIKEAVRDSSAVKIYICNMMTQPGETDGYSAMDHIQAIEEHASKLFNHVFVNTATAPPDVIQKYSVEGRHPVKANLDVIRNRGYMPVCGDFLAKGDLARHDPHLLAKSVMDFWAQSFNIRLASN